MHSAGACEEHFQGYGNDRLVFICRRRTFADC